MNRKLPPSASITMPETGVKLQAPSAERNAAALSDLICTHAPSTGHALEIASGTGQHIATFATALPAINWHPSEVEPNRRASIDAYAAHLPNVAQAITLNATALGWAGQVPPKDLIILINLLHLISTNDARILVSEAAQALSPSGTLILYGPFKRSGSLTSDGDARFDAELRGADPRIGYKDDLDILAWLNEAGLETTQPISMPANNLAFIARKARWFQPVDATL